MPPRFLCDFLHPQAPAIRRGGRDSKDEAASANPGSEEPDPATGKRGGTSHENGLVVATQLLPALPRFSGALENRFKQRETKADLHKIQLCQSDDRFTTAAGRFMALAEESDLEFLARNPNAGRDSIRKGAGRAACTFRHAGLPGPVLRPAHRTAPGPTHLP